MSISTLFPETKEPQNIEHQDNPEFSGPAVGSALKSGSHRIAWRAIQITVWTAGALLFWALIFSPQAGLHAFWNVLIPVAPAVFAFVPGIWRNVCPLGATALFPRHLGLSRRRKLTLEWQSRLGLIGVLLLFLIIPLRHVVFNMNGPATALILALIACGAFALGFLFEWKSAWCSGACPIYPVEKLYGSNPALTPPNAHCHPCEKCVSPCPDSTPNPSPFTFSKDSIRNLTALLMIGAFPGYLWGWFHVPDFWEGDGWSHLDLVYGYPLLAGAATLVAFLLIRLVLPARHHGHLSLALAAGAIACYYWYRLPALFGFGLFPIDGMLINLAAWLPGWFPIASQVATTSLFAWWFFGRKDKKRAWSVRPEFSERGVSN